MAKYQITIRQTFDAPIETIFNQMTDHATFGRIVGADIERIKDSPGENPNGEASVRRIRTPIGAAFEETVTRFEPNRLMTYTITKGSPIKNHLGRMAFLEDAGATRLEYFIEFDPKLPFVILGPMIKKLIESPIRKGIERFADRCRDERRTP